MQKQVEEDGLSTHFQGKHVLLFEKKDTLEVLKNTNRTT
jgi:hypothetical protein